MGQRNAPHRGVSRQAAALLALAILCGCAGLPPGANFPKTASVAFAQPEDTRLGQQFASAAHEHEGYSAFRIISIGVDGFQLRMQLIEAAQRTLDLQYYIFRGDETGRMLTDGLRHAADRGVRIRVLIDDGDFTAGPIVSELSGTFDEFWNSDLAIPARALKHTGPPDTGMVARTEDESASRRPRAGPPKVAAIDYASLLKTGEPFAGISSGR